MAVNVKLVIYQFNLTWNPSPFIKVSKAVWLHELRIPWGRSILETYTNLVLSSVDGCEEEQVGQEEAERELQVEGGAGVLDGFAQQEGEGRQEEAQQREAQPHVGDHSQCGILLLGPSREETTATLCCSE